MMYRLVLISCLLVSFSLFNLVGVKTDLNTNSDQQRPSDKSQLELGKRLFHDPILSGSNQISCASCHIPDRYFSDSVAFSIGHGNAKTARNSMSLVNLTSSAPFFWDGRVKTLEEFIFHPIMNKSEMNQNPDSLVLELKSTPSYLNAFEICFPQQGISKETISVAVAKYVGSLKSNHSILDSLVVELKKEYENGELDDPSTYKEALLPNFSKSVINALNLCEKCHNGPNYGGIGFRNNGLDSLPTDYGRFAVTNDTLDIGKFKVVSLRNIAHTGPYMHDGRLSTLKQVVQHYNNGIKRSPTLDSLLLDSSGNPLKLNLSEEEIEQVLQFLKLLSDRRFLAKHSSVEY